MRFTIYEPKSVRPLNSACEKNPIYYPVNHDRHIS